MRRRSLMLAFPFSWLLVAVLAAQTPSGTPAPAVDDIIARNVQAKGGAGRIAAVQTMKQTARMTSMGMEADITIYVKRPNMVRQELAGGGTTMIMAFDGTMAWGVNPQTGPAPIPLTGDNAAMVKEQAHMDGPLVNYKEKGNTVEFFATESVGSRRAHRLKVTSPTGRVMHCYIDTETGLEMKIVTEDPRGTVEQELSDYRDVEGLKMPFQIKTLIGGVPTVSITVTKVEVNPTIDDAIFRIPK